MKRIVKTAFTATVPVMSGYLVLGFGFGVILRANGFHILLAAAMSAFIYAGSMQYVAIGLLTGGASLLTSAMTALMVNARHLFYGISMLETYRGTGKIKPYLIFALTDETYSLVCGDLSHIPAEARKGYFLLVSLFNHLYWIVGSVLGALAGTLVRFDSTGIDFALTALFVTVLLDQWMGTKKHGPALIGVGASVVCLLSFGRDRFLIPAMLVITLLLCIRKEGPAHE